VFRIDVCYRKLGTECGQTRSRKNGENNSNRVGTHERRWMALLAISAFWQLCGSFTAPAAVDFGTEHQHRSLSLVGQAQVAGSTLEPPASEPRAAVYRRNGGLAEQALPMDIPMQWRDCAGCSGASAVKIQHGGL